jgi:hypothetical protein
MIFATTMTIGIAVGLMRSLSSVVTVAVLIGLSYVAAVCTSAGSVPLMSLLLAIAGYNTALIGLVLVMFALERPRSA